MLNLDNISFDRAEDGSLLPQEVELEGMPEIDGKKPTIKIKPLTRGKLLEIHNKAMNGTSEEKLQSDNDVIMNGLVEPKITKEQLEFITPQYATAISTAIIAVSLKINQIDVLKQAEDAVALQESELKKK